MSTQEFFDLWGGRAEVIAPDDGAAEAVAVVQRFVARVDATCSTFRDDSDISRVNRRSGTWVDVDPLFTEALCAALDMARATDGLVDPAIGTVTTPADDLTTHRVRGAWRDVEVHGTRVRIPRDTRLDLGATAKAWCADRAAHLAAGAIGAGVLVGLCGDIAVAGPAPDDGWSIECGDDHRTPVQGITDAQLCVREGGVATSSTTVRRRAGKRLGTTVAHIVDPRTLHPVAGPWRTVSVAARTCLEANAASTAAIVRGTEATRWLEHLRLPARLVRGDGRVVTTSGWPS